MARTAGTAHAVAARSEAFIRSVHARTASTLARGDGAGRGMRQRAFSGLGALGGLDRYGNGYRPRCIKGGAPTRARCTELRTS